MMGFSCIFLTNFIALCLVSRNGADSSVELSTAILIEVDQSGKGDFQQIQDAIDSVQPNNSEHVFILIKPGIYREKIVIPTNKPFITLSGSKASETIITWGDSGEIFDSPTFSVLASDFMARYLTIQNSHGSGAQAVALRVSGDRAAFISCRIVSHQDTLLDDRGRHYYSNCYIEGETDFICGNAASLFEECQLHSLSRGTGAITAQRRQSVAEETGFTFVNCNITGVKSALLGRPWGAYSRVVFAFTYMSKVILPQGWDDWGDSSKQRSAYYGEYRCYGPGSRSSKRVNWSRNLSSQEAEPYLTVGIIGGRSWIRSAPTRFRRVSSGANGPHVNKSS